MTNKRKVKRFKRMQNVNLLRKSRIRKHLRDGARVFRSYIHKTRIPISVVVSLLAFPRSVRSLKLAEELIKGL